MVLAGQPGTFRCEHCGDEVAVPRMWHLREGSHVAEICPGCALAAYEPWPPRKLHRFELLIGGRRRRRRVAG